MKSRLLFLRTTFVDFTESYKNDERGATQSPYFGYQCFIVYPVCHYTKSPNNNDARDGNVIVVTESSNHERIAYISCLQKVIHKIKRMHEKTYENVYVWSDGMGSQFISCYVFKLLASTVLPGKRLS